MLYHKVFPHKSSDTWVVFVHGAGGSNVVWFRQLREFKKHFNVLLVDLRGHGKSKKEYTQAEIYAFDEIAMDVIKTMDHLKIEKAHLVGISLAVRPGKGYYIPVGHKTGEHQLPIEQVVTFYFSPCPIGHKVPLFHPANTLLFSALIDMPYNQIGRHLV